MTQQAAIEFEGKNYLWNGKNWYETGTYLVPPLRILHKLNQQMTHILMQEDASISDVKTLLNRAYFARKASQLKRAENLIRKALKLKPGHPIGLAMLCATIRKQNKQEQALEETKAFKNAGFPSLLTARAAVLCDLERWEVAKKEVGRALAIIGNGNKIEAFNVVSRIKAERPDLYNKAGRH